MKKNQLFLERIQPKKIVFKLLLSGVVVTTTLLSSNGLASEPISTTPTNKGKNVRSLYSNSRDLTKPIFKGYSDIVTKVSAINATDTEPTIDDPYKQFTQEDYQNVFFSYDESTGGYLDNDALTNYTNYKKKGIKMKNRSFVIPVGGETEDHKQKWRVIFNQGTIWDRFDGYLSSPKLSFIISKDLTVEGNLKFARVEKSVFDKYPNASINEIKDATNGNDRIAVREVTNPNTLDYGKADKKIIERKSASLSGLFINTRDNPTYLRDIEDNSANLKLNDTRFGMSWLNNYPTGWFNGDYKKLTPTYIANDGGNGYAFTMNTPSNETRNDVVIVEFTTKRTVDTKKLEGLSRTFVTAIYNSHDGSQNLISADTKVVNISYDKDSDGDGLTDAFERYIGSDPHNVDSDGDGKPDGTKNMPGFTGKYEIEDTKPQEFGGLYKITGSDPTVGIVPKPLTNPKTTRGYIIKGKTEPNKTVDIYADGVLIAQTISDGEGNYEAEVGKKLQRTAESNKYGNNIRLKNDQADNFIGETEDITGTFPENPKKYEVAVWSDGFDNGNRPLFSKPEKTPFEKQTDAEFYDPIKPEKTPVKDINNLTDKEKEAVKNALLEANKDDERLNGILTNPETNISVADNGDITITYPDGTKDTITDNVKKNICTQSPNTNDIARNTLVGISTLNRGNDNWNLDGLSAYLALESNTKGFIITRNDNPSANITNPVEGMIVWDTTDNCLKLYSDKTGTAQWNCITQGCNQ